MFRASILNHFNPNMALLLSLLMTIYFMTLTEGSERLEGQPIYTKRADNIFLQLLVNEQKERRETENEFKKQISYLKQKVEKIEGNEQKGIIQKLEKELKKQVNYLQKKLEKIEGKQSPIAFSAALHSKKYSSSRLVLGQIITKIGNGYNSTKGKFVCPRSGLYLFSLSINTRDTNTASAFLMKNYSKVRHLTGGTNGVGLPSTTLTIVLKLKEGDEIWVKGESHMYYGNTVFTGVYIGK